MYLPKHFAITEQSELLEFINTFPFAALVTHSEAGLNAEHIPVLLEQDKSGKLSLLGHIAKANLLWQQHQDGAEVLVIFQGENAYISPNWYPSKKVDGKAVPTWNYRAVHAKGLIQFIHDDAWKLSFLEKLTQRHEATQPAPWAVQDAPSEYISQRLKGIVGIEIDVSEMQGKYKLSQNQKNENRQGVKDELNQQKNPMGKLI